MVRRVYIYQPGQFGAHTTMGEVVVYDDQKAGPDDSLHGQMPTMVGQSEGGKATGRWQHCCTLHAGESKLFMTDNRYRGQVMNQKTYGKYEPDEGERTRRQTGRARLQCAAQ